MRETDEDLVKFHANRALTLSYHLKTLAPFIEQKDGRYDLNPIGKAAYTLLLRTVTYNRMALLHKKKFRVIIGHIAHGLVQSPPGWFWK